MTPASFITALARARIGATFNQYRDSPLLRERLRAYLESRSDAPILLVGEAAGYGPAEATATIVQSVLRELGLVERVLLWNLVPTHPHRPGQPRSNRRPTRAEVAGGAPFVAELARGRRVVAVGRPAQAALGGPYVRHPSHGGAREFRVRLLELLA